MVSSYKQIYIHIFILKGRTPLVLAGIDNDFALKILLEGGDQTISTYNGGFDDDNDISEIGLQCIGEVSFRLQIMVLLSHKFIKVRNHVIAIFIQLLKKATRGQVFFVTN